tara:strand:+ start:13145 stop:14338 length:1194 start_codon:yes stop_codon:yes gene_type:complete
MQSVILVGGKGSRLGEITKDYPKPMLEVDGEPFIMKLINMLARFGSTEILLLACHANKVIIDYFKDKEIDGCNIKVIIEDELLGTGGSLINAYDSLEESFFCFNGDSIIDGNWLSIKNILGDNDNISIALTRTNDKNRYGQVELSNKKVTNFLEKQKNNNLSNNLINGGIYYIRKKIFDSLPNKKFSFERDIIPNQVQANKVVAQEVKGYFIDIGLEESLEQARAYNWRRGRKAIIFDRDGTLNHDDGYTHKISDLKWNLGAKEAIKLFNDKGYYVFVATNQSGIAKGKFSEDEMHKFHNEMKSHLYDIGAHIDKIYFCPYHKESKIKKYKVDSNDRKPKTGMLEKISKDWGIEKNNMVMIGNSTDDIECANNFGIRSFLYNGIDNLYEISNNIEKI